VRPRGVIGLVWVVPNCVPSLALMQSTFLSVSVALQHFIAIHFPRNDLRFRSTADSGKQDVTWAT